MSISTRSPRNSIGIGCSSAIAVERGLLKLLQMVQIQQKSYMSREREGPSVFFRLHGPITRAITNFSHWLKHTGSAGGMIFKQVSLKILPIPT